MTSLGFALGRPYPPVTSAAAGKRMALGISSETWAARWQVGFL